MFRGFFVGFFFFTTKSLISTPTFASSRRLSEARRQTQDQQESGQHNPRIHHPTPWTTDYSEWDLPEFTSRQTLGGPVSAREQELFLQHRLCNWRSHLTDKERALLTHTHYAPGTQGGGGARTRARVCVCVSGCLWLKKCSDA